MERRIPWMTGRAWRENTMRPPAWEAGEPTLPDGREAGSAPVPGTVGKAAFRDARADQAARKRDVRALGQPGLETEMPSAASYYVLKGSSLRQS